MPDINVEKKQKKNKIILAVLLLTPVMVMIAATITFKIGYVPDTRKNSGTLISPPQEISQLVLQDQRGEPYDYTADNKDYGRWHLFVFGDQSCQQTSCQDQLWLTRQLHVALAHRAHYVKRYYISVGGPVVQSLQDTFDKDHSRLQWLQTSSADYRQFLRGFENKKIDPLDAKQFLLVDPNGWAMMYYDDQNTGGDVIDDLKYLLKKRGK